jgi:hypothetical protein
MPEWSGRLSLAAYERTALAVNIRGAGWAAPAITMAEPHFPVRIKTAAPDLD